MNHVVTTAQLFEAFAGVDEELWRLAVGQVVVHATFDLGLITNVRSSNSGSVIVFVDFSNPHGSKELVSSIFANASRISEMTLPDVGSLEIYRDLAISRAKEESAREHQRKQRVFDYEVRARLEKDRIEAAKKDHARNQAEIREVQLRRENQRREEARQWQINEARILEQRRIRAQHESESREEFALLRDKYCASGYVGTSPANPLYPILLELEANGMVSDDQMQWLEHHHMHGTIAILYEKAFERTGDIWQLILASGKWRSFGDPQKALDAINRVSLSHTKYDRRLSAAILTTKGGAYRDLGSFQEALACAEQALDLTPNSFYPFNLLGGIYYDQGNPVQGDIYFQRALDLGANPREVNGQIRRSVQRMVESDQIATARYLFEKDPIKFSWAKAYCA